MLGIFHKGLANPPEELNSPASYKGLKKPKLPEEILREFISHHPDNTCSMNFGKAALAYVRPDKPFSVHQRLFCGLDDIYCLFLGSLNNLSLLNKQYGLSKGTDEAMFLIEAYRTLRDRGPYPPDQVVKELDGSFAFVVYDSTFGTVFAALGSDGGLKLYWGIAADGSVVISDDLNVIQEGCAKFPAATMVNNVRFTLCSNYGYMNSWFPEEFLIGNYVSCVEFLRDLLLTVFLAFCLVLGVTRMGGAFVLFLLLAFACLVQA